MSIRSLVSRHGPSIGRWILALLVGAGCGGAWAQEQAPADASHFGRKYPPRIYKTGRLQAKPPAIDGKLDDEAWKEGEWAGEYTQNMPTEGAKPSERTELKILYDDKYVYFAVHAYDDPTKVHRYPGRRDAFTGDIVGICFNSYNDKRTGFEFDLTAGGSKIDLVLGNGENEWDTTWDAVWDGAVANDDTGWTAEFRVPLSQLRYGPQEEQVWGLHAWRWIDRLQEEDQWQLIPRQNTGRMYNLGELHGISGLKHSRHLEILPHVVGQDASNPGRTGGTATGGVDLKLGVTTNFTLDATVNPDFGQVEADPSVINLTAYETFYDEKRPFFLEGKKILSFGLEDSDQLFYTRRIGQAPSYSPTLGADETIHSPDSTTILGALKLTGKTPGGLSVAVLQSLTQKETAQITFPSGERRAPVEPFGSYTVARLHKDWGQGNTSLGGMMTSAHRWTTDPTLAFLPTQALTGGVDFTRYFGNRSWVLEASTVFSHVSGDREAITELQRNAVHYYQRPDASHLGVDENATSLVGHGGSVHFGRSEKDRFRLTDHFHWYSPGLELNDLGYLRQADILANQASVGWAEPSPKGIFRTYSLQLSREDDWNFGGLATHATTTLDASAMFKNKWTTTGRFAFNQVVDTGALHGGPALRWHQYFSALLNTATDNSRRFWVGAQAERAWTIDDDSGSTNLLASLHLRPSNRLSLSGQASYETKTDSLQYAATAESAGGPRFVLGRIRQDTWAFTFRANLSITPELTVQYYGSPFIGTGRYSSFKKATDTLATAYADRFRLYAPGEIAQDAATNRYVVSEAQGGTGAGYSFDNPDFSFRQFRSNLVVRWEYKPGSSFYAVWSQGRTDSVATWESSFSSNWDALWRARSDNVFLVKLSYWFSP
jgi:Domain of unknown function (DUF5916)/Carbohydrate family 9 binding domain-like